ncbi:MAG TPA: hypothetical protein PLK90_00685 [Clostridiales bacterium]|nr:hypothetical protein [Clostridiales bacterium]
MRIMNITAAVVLISGMLISLTAGDTAEPVIKYNGLRNAIIAQSDTDLETAPETIGSTPRIKSKKRAEYSEGKSPLVAAGLSLLVPGAGEFYGRDYIRSGIFFGIDVLTLSMWYYYESDGDDRKDEYREYADARFSDSLYYGGLLSMTQNSYNWLNYNGNSSVWSYDYFMNRDNWSKETPTEDIADSLTVVKLLKYSFNVFNGVSVSIEGSSDQFTHNLPETKTQQYYEMVGKYHQFACGWNDFTGYVDEDHDGVIDTKTVVAGDTTITIPILKIENGKFNYSEDGYISAKVDFYEDLRDEANKAYEMGQNFLMVTLLNHVASAFDASYVIKSRYQIDTQLRIESNDTGEIISPDNYKITYSVSW